MRTSPAVEVVLTRFAAWQFAVGALAAASGLSALAWGTTQQRLPPAAAGVAIAAVLCALAWLARSLVRVPHARLRWDGRGWQLWRAGSVSGESVAGEVVVAIDLGSWLLLRFDSLNGHRSASPVWLPVQRAGIEPQWHALRCAVYSPRPVAGAEGVSP